MSKKDFYINDDEFRVWLPDVMFKSSNSNNEDAHNSRQMVGVMSTDRKDRQGEKVTAKGLDFEDFLHNGHFNDNHSQDTSKIVGYPEAVSFHKDLSQFGLKGTAGWTCRGYVLKGTRRSDDIWELAKALADIPDKKLGFSIEGKVLRRKDKTIEKAKIRNVAITNCPVNTDCTWSLFSKSFYDEEMAFKSLSAGHGASIGEQSGGGALRTEDLDDEEKDVSFGAKKRKKIEKSLRLVMGFDGIIDAVEHVLARRPDFSEEAAIHLVQHLHNKGGVL